MDKQMLQSYTDAGMSMAEIATAVGATKNGVRYWLIKYGLKTVRTKGKEKWKKYTCPCGENDPTNFYPAKRFECKACTNTRQKRWAADIKHRLVEYKGGKCCLCGYSKCLGSLQFHHVDPKKKDPEWNVKRNRCFERMKEEIDKCVLVCANCHAEIHNGFHPHLTVSVA